MSDFGCPRNSSTNANFSAIQEFANSTFPGDPVYFKTLEPEDIIKILGYIIIIVGGLLGNVSVILTVALNRSMRTTINFYVANLAVADFLICVFCMGPHLLATLTYPFFLMGEFMCKFNPFMQMTCLTGSVLTLSAISCDRFMAVMFPMQVRITKQRTSVVMKCVWILSIIVATPFLIIKKHVVIKWQNFQEPRCWELWPEEHYYDESIQDCRSYEPLKSIYYIVVTLTLYFLPVAIMITAYSLILWKLWVSEVPGERHAANLNCQSRARKKVIKMVFVVLLAFIVCWSPFQFMVLYYAYGHSPDTQIPEWLLEFAWYSYYIAYANSFINPIIYGSFNKTFREGFCIVLGCGLQRGRFSRPARSRMTFTTGITSSPSRYASKTINGTGKNTSQKSTDMEMRPFRRTYDGNSSPSMKDTCVSIAESTNSVTYT